MRIGETGLKGLIYLIDLFCERQGAQGCQWAWKGDMLGKVLNPLAFGWFFEQGTEQGRFGQIKLQTQARPAHPAKVTKNSLREKAAVARAELAARGVDLKAVDAVFMLTWESTRLVSVVPRRPRCAARKNKKM